MPRSYLTACAALALCACGGGAPVETSDAPAERAATETTAEAVETAQTPAMQPGAAVIPASASGDDAAAAAPAQSPEPDPVVAPEDSQAFIERFENLDESAWYIASDFAIPEPWVDTTWRRAAIERLRPGLRYRVYEEDGGEKAFGGASIQKLVQGGNDHKFGYGRFETVMTAAEGDGLVSNFFSYTGEFFGDEQHEIDFEFLGKDTSQVQLNYHLRGDGEHIQMIDLGYDAHDTPNLYAFEWRPGSIKWFVGDVLVHEVSGPVDDLPSLPGMIFSQLWAAGAPAKGWTGHPVTLERPTAEVFCISYKEHGAEAEQCSDGFESVNTATPAPSVR